MWGSLVQVQAGRQRIKWANLDCNEGQALNGGMRRIMLQRKSIYLWLYSKIVVILNGSRVLLGVFSNMQAAGFDSLMRWGPKRGVITLQKGCGPV